MGFICWSEARSGSPGQDADHPGRARGPGGHHLAGPPARLGGHAAHRRSHDRGIISSTLLTLIVSPAIYGLANGRELPREAEASRPEEAAGATVIKPAAE
ncbi:hypothetical protein SAMN02927923_01824 [Microvirga guangxiensis]|uniref:AcrB/AcrD/AcrF family protein n=1 Tax=Microvirga guangxiensis TaxID=549386 RepID=A0A1G5HMJ0_9HYPH|nr:hypothetical protein SAMN02927923_01824 [Microvirga guangxiensis]